LPAQLKIEEGQKTSERFPAWRINAVNSLRGTAAPKGLPSPIRERLVTAVAKVAADPEFQAKMKESYTPMWFLTPDEFAATLQKSDDEFRALWKENPWVEK
jgi:tripartite-type tricarboxylate transporter receptor subunit TctC